MRYLQRWKGPLLLVLIIALAGALRLYGLNWDDGHSFHPDERQILFQVIKLSWPQSWASFLDPVNSPLNPHFFAYGSFPLYLLAILEGIFIHTPDDMVRFTQMMYLGRVVSALFDTGTVLLASLLTLRLASTTPSLRISRRPWLWALTVAGLLAFTPLHLQLSHFYAVDTMLVFFALLTLLACQMYMTSKRPLLWILLAGLGYGLAIATKFSAVPLALPLLLACSIRWYREREIFNFFVFPAYAFVVAAITFIVAQPYALLDVRNYLAQIAEQGDMARGLRDYPYVRQFAGTIPFLYQLNNMVFWGLGLLLGIAALLGFLWLLERLWRGRMLTWAPVLGWILVYGGINCTFYVKFMRYLLPIYPFLVLVGATAVLSLCFWIWERLRDFRVGWLKPLLSFGLLFLVLGGTIFQGLSLLDLYSVPNTRIQASRWLYSNIPAGKVITYEQWDDSLPVDLDGHSAYEYTQATYRTDNGGIQTGLDLYQEDSISKAQYLANMLSQLDALVMSSDRLYLSIPRLPDRYPLTIRYYNLLFNGELGFRLAVQFENQPHLFGVTLNDKSADESYSVFDHPTVRIFMREKKYSADEILNKLLDGMKLPPQTSGLSGAQKSLLLTPQQIDDNQQGPTFGQQFADGSLSNHFPVFCWLLVLWGLGMIGFPLTFPFLRRCADGGYMLSRLLSVLLIAFAVWWLAFMRLLPFQYGTILLLVVLFALSGCLAGWVQRRTIWSYVRQRWRTFCWTEIVFLSLFFLFLWLRASNPDLWHDTHGGEKPMEMAFLNGTLRSSYFPSLDPWFSGGYINYYYYGYVVWSTLIKLTGIAPAVAFNLIIPTLAALTLAIGAMCIYTLTHSWRLAILGVCFLGIVGNLESFSQLVQQASAWFSGHVIPYFDYWQSSRVLDGTINENPFWSFLFADLHPHVINLPVNISFLFLLALWYTQDQTSETMSARFASGGLIALSLFVLGTLACINPWDMPVYVTLWLAVLLLRLRVEAHSLFEGVRMVIGGICGLGCSFLAFLPYYLTYQQLYAQGIGIVIQQSELLPLLSVFGFWISIGVSFWIARLGIFWRRWRWWHWWVAGAISVMLIELLIFSSVLALWAGMFIIGGYSFWRMFKHAKGELVRGGMYGELLFLLGVVICMGLEVVYVQDFLDGSSYARMNTFFKFSLQAWLCFALGGALLVWQMRSVLVGWWRRGWTSLLLCALVLFSAFLFEGPEARIHERLSWSSSVSALPDQMPMTLDGLAFAAYRYPGDYQAIKWINEHVSGVPVVLEGCSPGDYQWGGRISTYTGLPTVLGWSEHEAEQRYSQQTENRLADIISIYTTNNIDYALQLLHYYHVQYIYIGDLERSTYGSVTDGLAKFELMQGRGLDIVYHDQNTTLYAVRI